MDLYTHPLIFRILKVLQLLLTLVCLALEITQIVASSEYAPKPFKYFGEYNNLGMKIFFYVVIPITLCIVGWYLVNFNTYWRNPSAYRDVGADSFLTILWVVAGLTNIFPMYSDYISICPTITMMSSPGHIYARRIVCQAYIASMSIGWANAALFMVSTVFSWRLSKELEWRGAITSLNRQSSISQISRRNSNRTSSLP
ncbi:hypothetical protein C1645_769928 [Glomus cerebriforme]|uniref:MARVEL domain-containing protein n=1 Tax=Glomus cerebriforme TaxID=658196 RepID=A0A397SXR8_9GLOM|nr:hypothetical protein C1645_769928 [Glomus cerebriforme]